jgi:hypothetical protein
MIGEASLKKGEWVYGDGDYFCPWCGIPPNEHKPDCEFAQALAAIKAWREGK